MSTTCRLAIAQGPRHYFSEWSRSHVEVQDPGSSLGQDSTNLDLFYEVVPGQVTASTPAHYYHRIPPRLLDVSTHTRLRIDLASSLLGLETPKPRAPMI